MTTHWQPQSGPQSPREQRTAKLLPVEIGSERFGRTKVVVRNISPYGLGVRADIELLACERVTVYLPGDLEIGATVRWVRKGTFGLALDAPIDPSLLRAKPAASPNDITTKDAQVGFIPMHIQNVVQQRPGFQRSQRDVVLNGHSHWIRD
jgi:hypothetical protein